MKATAFSPAHITGFFEISLRSGNSLLSGSRGAGFSISKGVVTEVSVRKSEKPLIRIRMNGKPISDNYVSYVVARTFLEKTGSASEVEVEHWAEVPFGSGFGSSGAAALSLAYALNETLHAGLSKIEAAQIAHSAELACKTGLGTVIAETYGGIEMRVKAGAPGVGNILKIPVGGYSAVTLHLGPISTPKILTNQEWMRRINGTGGKLLKELRTEPSAEKFVLLSKSFADSCGFMTGRIKDAVEQASQRGFTCSMAMFGKTVFSLVKRDETEELASVLKTFAPEGGVMVCDVDEKGAKLL